MKNKIIVSLKSVFFLMVIFLLSNTTFAQNDPMNHSKYWYYRWRLLNDFMVVGPTSQCPSGNCPGYSLPASRRFIVHWDPQMDFGEDGTISLGYYLGVLATEYHLLSTYGQDLTQTKKELYYALKAINRLDLNAEPYMEEQYEEVNANSVQCGSSLNGFFIRGDAPVNFVTTYLDHFNQEKTALQHIVSGNPVLVNQTNTIFETGPSYHNEMSQDQAIGLLLGLRLVAEFVDNSAVYTDPQTNTAMEFEEEPITNYSLLEEAKLITKRIMYWIKGVSDWNIQRPSCIGGHVQRGNFALEYSWGLAKVACEITGESEYCNYVNNPAAYTGWQGTMGVFAFEPGTNSNPGSFYANKFMLLELMACGSNSNFSTNTYLRNNTDDDLPYKTEWLTLLHSILNDYSTTSDFWPQRYIDYLNTSQCQGPYAGYTDNTYPAPSIVYNWSAPSLLTKPEGRQQPPLIFPPFWEGEFNGIDYMLLYNLYRIKVLQEGSGFQNPGLGPGYSNMINPLINSNLPITITPPVGSPITLGSHSNPMEFQAFEVLTANNSIGSNGDVTYRAGDEIILTNGFQAAAGADFYGYVKKFECDYGDSYYRNSETGPQQITVMEITRPVNSAYKHSHENIFSEVSINDENEVDQGSSIILSPNPNSGNFYLSVESKYTTGSNLTIVDPSGRIFLSQTIILTEGYNQIEISKPELPSGIYFVKVDGFEEPVKMIIAK